MPEFLGYNQYGVLINKNLQGVTLSCSPEVGEIAPDGRLWLQVRRVDLLRLLTITI